MQIFNCALELFKERGYANVSVKDICEALGITRNAFYYHFKTRDAIFDDFFLFSNLYIAENLATILASDNYLEQFYMIYNIYLECSVQHGYEVLAQVYKRNLDLGMNQFVPRDVGAFNVYVTLLKKAQGAGQIRNTKPPEELAEAAIYAGDGISMIWCTSRGKIDIKAETRRIFDSMFMVP